MRQILSDIRALSGVTGVAVIAKRTGKIEHFFPAAFTERHTQFLRELITSTYQRLRGFTRLALRFERVVVHLYNQPEYLLFVTTLPDTDTRQFEMVVNSKLGSISRELVQSGNAMVPGTATVTGVSQARDAREAREAHPTPAPSKPAADDSILRAGLRSRWREARDHRIELRRRYVADAPCASGLEFKRADHALERRRFLVVRRRRRGLGLHVS